MFETDVIIIGSGPIGAMAASKLAKRQKKVLILEAGCAISEPPAAHLRNQRAYQQYPDRFFEEMTCQCNFFDSRDCA